MGGKSLFYSATIEGEFSEYSYPVDSRLELKAGAQVMFVKNDPTGQQRFFNGRIASVLSLSHDEIAVKFDDPKRLFFWKSMNGKTSGLSLIGIRGD